MEIRYQQYPVFDFDDFIGRRYGSTTYISMNTPQLPETAYPETRKQIEAIVSSIDLTTVKALLLHAVIDHERHAGQLVALHCETFAKTTGTLWNCGDETYKFVGEVREAIDTLDSLLVERLLVDLALTFRNVATSVSAANKRRSRQVEIALHDIQSDYEQCRYLIRELGEDWREHTDGLRSMPSFDHQIAPEAATDIASSLAKLPVIMESVTCWETRRNIMLAF